jgi:peptidoglycan LD-endopeptidase CwlK
MSRKLDDLSDRMKPLAFELIARCVEQGIAVMIIDTLRTPADQAEYIKNGVSWTRNSKHLTGDAIDLAPYETYLIHGSRKLEWNANDPAWKVMGRIGEGLGLGWGGRWAQRDMGHFEYRESHDGNLRRT